MNNLRNDFLKIKNFHRTALLILVIVPILILTFVGLNKPNNTVLLVTLFGIAILTGISALFIYNRIQSAASAQLKALFDSGADALITINDNGVIHYTNPSTQTLFGYSSEEIQNINLSMLLSPSSKPIFEQFLRNNQLNANKLALTGLRKDGTSFEMSLNFNQNGMNNDATCIVSVRDISDDFNTKIALKQQEQQFSQLIENLSTAAFIIDTTHTVLHWNNACEVLSGIPKEDIIGTTDAWRGFYVEQRSTLADLVLDGNTNDAKNLYQTAHQSPQSPHNWHAEGWFENLNGKRRYVDIDAAPLFDEAGNVVAVLETFQDFTEGKLAILAKELPAQKIVDSDKQIEILFNTVLEGLIIISDHGIIQNANPAASKIFGYTNAEMVGQNVKMLMPAKVKKEHDGYLKNYRTTGDAKVIGSGREVVGRRKDGTPFAMDLAVSEIQINGKAMYVGTTRDISERRHAERLYRQMSENVSGYATIILDTEGNIKTWNQGAKNLKGYDNEEVIGHSFKMFYTPEDIDSGLPEKLIQTCIEEGHVEDEGWRIRKDGTQFFASVVLNSLEEDDGSLVGFVKVTRDATDRKQMDTELRQAYANLEEFTAVASHDLKSPIRGIADLVEWVKEDLGDDLQEVVQGNLDRIQLRINRMETLIEDLLQYSRAGRVTAEITLIEPIEVVQEILELLSFPDGFNIVIKGKSSKFKAAKTPLQTTLRNLISNAIKHHDKDEGNITININTEGSYCIFTVEDDGPGIPESAQARVFKLFQSLSKSADSTGIGLAVSKRMTEAHGGRIEVESNVEKRGTKFRVWWPKFQLQITES